MKGCDVTSFLLFTTTTTQDAKSCKYQVHHFMH